MSVLRRSTRPLLSRLAHNDQPRKLGRSRLRGFFIEGEVVELMAAIDLFNHFNCLNDLLHTEPTPPALAEELASVGDIADV